MRFLEHVQCRAEDFLLWNRVLTWRSWCRSLFPRRRDGRLRFCRQIHSGRVERVERRRGTVRRRFLHRGLAVVSADLRRRHRVSFVLQHVVGMEPVEVGIDAALRLQHQLELVETHLADGLLGVKDLRHVARMPELVLVRRQVLVLADPLQKGRELGFRTNALDVQLVLRQIHRDAEGLLEWRIVNDRTDFIVLTRCVQVIR